MADRFAALNAALAGRYTIARELGRGGMATVYLAEDSKHRRKVAVKVLRPELAAALGPDRFLREIAIAARLTHPHILPLHDSGEANGFLYYVMPYLEGESLRDRLSREKQLPLEDALQIARDVADALSYAHGLGLIHRDIKPENILFEAGHAVVTDFGIARAITAAGGEKLDERLTETGVTVGTPAYMSPEQATGGNQLDGRSDVYSLACVLYEMLAGEPPYTGPTPASLIHQHLAAEVPRVTGIRAAVPTPVANALARALAKGPADRYANARQFAEALAASETATAPAPPLAAVRRTLGAVAVLVALALVMTTAYFWRPWRPGGDTARSGTGSSVASVAVLPFENIGGGSEEQYFTEGMTDEIITQLAQVQGLKVISRTSVVALSGSRLTLPQIAETLRVRHIVEGTIRRAGDSVRVSVELVDAKTDAHLWAASYDRRLAGIFAIQDEIARQVSSALVATVHGLRSATSRTEQTAAYDAYLEGKYWLQRRTAEGFSRALRALNRAIAIDSAYAPAYAALSSLHSLCYGHRACPQEVVEDSTSVRAVRLANRAIALDSALAEGYAARAYAATVGDGPIEIALSDLEHAFNLRLNSGEIHLWYGAALNVAGRSNEALAQMDTAVSLDPLAPAIRIGYAILALNARRPEVALREARRAKVLEPGLRNSVRFEALALLLLGRVTECTSLDLERFPAVRAMCLHTAGRDVEAQAILDSVRRRALQPGNRGTMAEVATYYAWVAKPDSAAVWLTRAGGSGNSIIQWFIRSELFDPVRYDRRFQLALQGMTEHDRDRFLEELQQTRGRRP